MWCPSYIYSNNTIHSIVQDNNPSVLLSVPSAAELRAALVAAEASEGSAHLHHDNGTLIVHLAACLDETHAAQAVGQPATAASRPLEYLKLFWCFGFSKSCCQIVPGCRNITKSKC
jgi:hypothetical protein